MATGPRVSCALISLVGLSACSDRLIYGAWRARGDDEGDARVADAATSSDGSVEGLDGALAHEGGSSDADLADGKVPDAAPLAFCAPERDGFSLSDRGTLRCSSLAEARFERGLCACEDLQSGGLLRSDAFDSELGPYVAPGLAGGSLAMNGAFYPAAAELGGSLVVGGDAGAPITGDLQVGESLISAGPLDGPYAVEVGGDVQVLSDLRVSSLTLGGSLHVGASSDVEITQGAPAFSRDAAPVIAPCDCTQLVDVGAEIDARARDNDNTQIGLDAAGGLSAIDAARELILPCGRYYVDEVYAAQPLTLTITGNVELYVRGSLATDLAGSLAIELVPGAQLDLFLGQGVSLLNDATIGDRSAPTRTRVFVAPETTLSFGGALTLAGLVYAPGSSWSSSGRAQLFGAFTLGGVSSGPLELHQDLALSRCD
ncbi:MAG: hypothetical protein QM778_23850 [Myxococcales bacterium]